MSQPSRRRSRWVTLGLSMNFTALVENDAGVERPCQEVADVGSSLGMWRRAAFWPSPHDGLGAGGGVPGSRRSARSAARTNGLDAGVAPASSAGGPVGVERCEHDVPGGRGSVRRQAGVRGSEPQVGDAQGVAPDFCRPSRCCWWASVARGSFLRRRFPGTSWSVSHSSHRPVSAVRRLGASALAGTGCVRRVRSSRPT